MADPENNIHVIDTEQVQDDHSYPPITTPSQQDKGLLEESNFSDGSEALFSMYLRRAREEDRKMVDSWKGYADGMLVFTGLFSGAVASFLSVTVHDIRPNPQVTSAFYLARIHQQLSSQLNQPQDPIPTSLSNNPAQSFSAPTSAIWVNGLWFLSLVVSLTCALMATLLQQWARRYLEVAYPRYSPHKRARIRTFYSEGVEDLHVPWTVEALPTLLHISLFLFFAGLGVFLFNVHLTIFGVVVAWIGLCVILYACLSFLPIIRKNSPYSGPLSSFFSFCVTGMRHLFFKLFEKSRRNPVHFFSHSMRKTAEDYALRRLQHHIDFRALWWTFESLDEDGELQEFFEGLLGLCSSTVVPNALQDFINPRKNFKMLSNELIGLMNRTLSSNLVSESVKQTRITMCAKVIGTTHLIGDWWILRRVLLDDWHGFLRCVEFGILAQKLKNNPDRVTALSAQCSAAVVISNVREVRERDDNWHKLVFGQLNTPKPVIYRYLSHGDSILLANLIFIVRRIVQAYSGSSERQQSDLLSVTSKTLKFVCKFDIKHTVPELQHEFCDLWNLLADKAENDERPRVKCITETILEYTRKQYDALHQRTNDATLYPRCTYLDHRPASPVEELQFDEPPPEPSPNPAHTPTPSAIIIPPSPGPPSTSAILASHSVASLQSHTSVPVSSSQP